MKTIIFFSLVIFSFSCKKNSSGSGFEVEYRITPTANYMGAVRYVDGTGPAEILGDLVNWENKSSKKFTVDTKPFHAMFTTELYAPPGNYEMIILVNGQVKNSISCVANENTPSPYTVEYHVE